MRFLALVLLFGSAALVASARPFPSRLDPEIWQRDGESSNCDGSAMKTCAMALAPTVGACGIAAAQAEIDLAADAACITEAISLGTDFPSSCTACMKRFENEVSNAEEKFKSKISNAEEEIKSKLRL